MASDIRPPADHSSLTEATSPYLDAEPRTLAQAQRDHDHTLVRQVIAELDAQQAVAAMHGDDETADTYHKRGMALARMMERDNV